MATDNLLTPELYSRLHLCHDTMDDLLKKKLHSRVLENLKDFRRFREAKLYPHSPTPASIEERRAVGGQLQFTEDGEEVDCTKIQCQKIIPDLNKVRVGDMKSSCGVFILVVQRYGTFRKLAVAAGDGDVFYKRYPCVIVNVEDELDPTTELFLLKLKTELKLPVYALVDSSPDGVKIMSAVSKCCGGCDVTWLGMTPSDLEEKGRFAIANDPRIRVPMTEGDLKTLEDLMENDEFVKRKMRDYKWVEENSNVDGAMKMMENLRMSNVTESGVKKNEKKNTWFEELTLMKESKKKTSVEDFDDFKNLLFSMLIESDRRVQARRDLLKALGSVLRRAIE